MTLACIGAGFGRRGDTSNDTASTGEEACKITQSNNLVGSSVLQEGSYSITHGDRGASVAFIASEPITGMAFGYHQDA